MHLKRSRILPVKMAAYIRPIPGLSKSMEKTISTTFRYPLRIVDFESSRTTPETTEAMDNNNADDKVGEDEQLIEQLKEVEMFLEMKKTSDPLYHLHEYLLHHLVGSIVDLSHLSFSMTPQFGIKRTDLTDALDALDRQDIIMICVAEELISRGCTQDEGGQSS